MDPVPNGYLSPFSSPEFTLYHKDCWVRVHCEVCHQCRLCKWVHRGLIVAAKGVLWGNEITNGTPYDPGLHKECEERLLDWKSTSHRHLGGHASYSGQKQFVQTGRGTVWLAFNSSLFRFSMAFRGCKYEISTGMLLGFPGPWYCSFLWGCATNCLKTFKDLIPQTSLLWNP